MKRFEFWRRILLATKVFEVALGLVLVVFSPRVLPLYSRYVAKALWDPGEIPRDAERFYLWIFAVLGATISGSALAQAWIIAGPFKRKERWAWHCLLWSLLLWCVPDTAFSLYYGVWPNAVFNLFPILFVALPLLTTRREFRR